MLHREWTQFRPGDDHPEGLDTEQGSTRGLDKDLVSPRVNGHRNWVMLCRPGRIDPEIGGGTLFNE